MSTGGPLYQKGTLLSHAGQLKKAERLLNEVVHKAPREDNKLAALHQLGVIDLKMCRFADAESRSQECLDRRSRTDFRRVYDYRRLGEVYANTGRLREARDAFDKAKKLVRDWSFYRYVGELRYARRRRRQRGKKAGPSSRQ